MKFSKIFINVSVPHPEICDFYMSLMAYRYLAEWQLVGELCWSVCVLFDVSVNSNKKMVRSISKPLSNHIKNNNCIDFSDNCPGRMVGA